MLTVEIKVNGCLIAHLYIHNEGKNLSYGLNGYSDYFYEYIEINKKSDRKSGKVRHFREYGALKLVCLCIEDMGKES